MADSEKIVNEMISQAPKSDKIRLLLMIDVVHSFQPTEDTKLLSYLQSDSNNGNLLPLLSVNQILILLYVFIYKRQFESFNFLYQKFESKMHTQLSLNPHLTLQNLRLTKTDRRVRSKLFEFRQNELKKINLKMLLHCLLDSLLYEYVWDDDGTTNNHEFASFDFNIPTGDDDDIKIKEDEIEKKKIKLLENGIKLYKYMINNYPCLQFLTVFCRELPHLYGKSLIKQLNVYPLIQQAVHVTNQNKDKDKKNGCNNKRKDKENTDYCVTYTDGNQECQLTPQCENILIKLFDDFAGARKKYGENEKDEVQVDHENDEDDEDDEEQDDDVKYDRKQIEKSENRVKSDNRNSGNMSNGNNGKNWECLQLFNSETKSKTMSVEDMIDFILACGAGYV